LAERFPGSHGLQLADGPFEMAPVQVNLIWHRQQEATPGLQWLREQIVQIEQG
ncbi:LysR family transcriptional regulator, partial [Pseudomonas aeruginosa]